MVIPTRVPPRLVALGVALTAVSLGLGGCSLVHLDSGSSLRPPARSASSRQAAAPASGQGPAPTVATPASAPAVRPTKPVRLTADGVLAFQPGHGVPTAPLPSLAFHPLRGTGNAGGGIERRPTVTGPAGGGMASPQPPATIWARLQAGFRLPGKSRPAVQRELRMYAAHPGTVDLMLQRAAPYIYLITQQIEKRDMPTELALLPAVESGYDPFAYSQGRAAGLWQFIPGTARRFGLRENWWFDGRRDVVNSTRAALDYLQALANYFHGDWLLALASYNAGRGLIDAQLRENRLRHQPETFWAIALPAETRHYVPRLLALSIIVSHPQEYGVQLPPVPNKPFLETVHVKGQIDLAVAARMAGISLADLYRYNPGYNRWATAPHGPHRLLVPVAKAARLRQRLAQLNPARQVQWVRHLIRPGETLNELAMRSRTTVALLQTVNHIHGKIIRAGHHILLPKPSKQLSRYTLSERERLQRIKEEPHGSRRLTHTVRHGESLWTIARHYRVRVSQLARWNGMAPTDTLHAGTRLVIWTGRRYAATEPIRRIRTVHYTVHPGDSLSRISYQFKVSVAQLRDWNEIDRGEYLQPGQRLILHVDVLRQSGS